MRVDRSNAEDLSKQCPGGKHRFVSGRCTLPETNGLHLEMDGWNTTFLLGKPIFRGYVSFREGI